MRANTAGLSNLGKQHQSIDPDLEIRAQDCMSLMSP